MQALGLLDLSGKPTPRLEAIETADMIRLSDEDWSAERDKMIKTCNDCHSINFVRAELEKSDHMIREADGVLAEAIQIVARLYQDGIIKKPENYSYAFPDLLTMHNAPTVIEQKLFTMFHEYRMRTFQGAFHSNPDYTFWYGWSAMQTGLTEIRERAADMREAAARRGQETPAKAQEAPAKVQETPARAPEAPAKVQETPAKAPIKRK